MYIVLCNDNPVIMFSPPSSLPLDYRTDAACRFCFTTQIRKLCRNPLVGQLSRLGGFFDGPLCPFLNITVKSQ